MTDTKLFFVKCTGPNVSDKTEYLKAESKEIVETSMKQAMAVMTSDYYGYTKVTVQQIDKIPETIIPELRQAEIQEFEIIPVKLPKEKQSKKTTFSEIKKLEGKIVYHLKSIQEIKSTIHEKRGDYDTYVEIGDCGTHKNCKIYNKPNSTKSIHRKIINQNSFYDTVLVSHFPNKYAETTIDLQSLNTHEPFTPIDFKFCTKPVEKVGCDGTCNTHYKCTICGQVHLTSKEAKKQKKFRESLKK